MILQALKEYYDRKISDPESNMAPLGWEWKEFLYMAEINLDGKFIKFHPYGENKNGKTRGKRFLVPSLGEKKGNGIKSNLLWENIEYMFGIPVSTKSKPNPDKKRVGEQHKSFCNRINKLDGNSETLQALRRFCEIEQEEVIKKDPLWDKIIKDNQSILMSVSGSIPATQDEHIRKSINKFCLSSKPDGICLVSGEKDQIVRLEAPLKGVAGDDGKAERSLVSFNIEAFLSFNKEKNFNSPIGKLASFAYTTALNHLLSKDSLQKMRVGDATAIFWSAKETIFEKQIVEFFGEPPKDDPDRGTRAVESLFNSVKNGAFFTDASSNKFFVLGLAPNASRISIRFWIVDTVAGMSGRICQHFEDLRVEHGPRDRDAFSLFRLLSAIAAQGKADNIPANLAGETMRSILEGLQYPETLLQASIRRNRAEHSVTYYRAALIKACINRKTRHKNPNIKEELKMSLDPTNTNIGYRLGRLFATLEKIQQEANPGINATIRDRFYGAASSTPSTVFGNLMRLSNHHLSKIEKEKVGLFKVRKRLLGEIIDGVECKISFPPHLCLDDQGRFAIGYYHQTQDFYTKKENK